MLPFKNNPWMVVAAVPQMQGLLQHPVPVLAYGRLESGTSSGRVTVTAWCLLPFPAGFLALRCPFAGE